MRGARSWRHCARSLSAPVRHQRHAETMALAVTESELEQGSANFGGLDSLGDDLRTQCVDHAMTVLTMSRLCSSSSSRWTKPWSISPGDP